MLPALRALVFVAALNGGASVRAQEPVPPQAPVIAQVPGDAQDKPPTPAMGTEALGVFAKALSQPDTPILPVTPERRALAREYIRQQFTDEHLKAMNSVAQSEVLSQFEGKLKSLPLQQQPLVRTAIVDAFNAAQAKKVQAMLDGMTAFYSERLTADDLRVIITWYDSDFSLRSRTAPQTLTLEDRPAGREICLGAPSGPEARRDIFGLFEAAAGRLSRGERGVRRGFPVRVLPGPCGGSASHVHLPWLGASGGRACALGEDAKRTGRGAILSGTRPAPATERFRQGCLRDR